MPQALGQQWQQPPHKHPWTPEPQSARDRDQERDRGRRRASASGPGGIRHARPLWKRLQLPYVAALLVLLPAMLVWPYMSEAKDAQERGTIPPQARLVTDGTGELAGSDWTVVGYLTGYLEDQPPPPDGVEIVDVGFRVTPGDESASALLESYCRFRAIDLDGRSWEPTNQFSLRNLADDPGMTMGGCTDGAGENIAPGAEQTLVLSFLVPAEVAEELRYEVTVGTSEDMQRRMPEALLFEAEPME